MSALSLTPTFHYLPRPMHGATAVSNFRGPRAVGTDRMTFLKGWGDDLLSEHCHRYFIVLVSHRGHYLTLGTVHHGVVHLGEKVCTLLCLSRPLLDSSLSRFPNGTLSVDPLWKFRSRHFEFCPSPEKFPRYAATFIVDMTSKH